MDKINKAIENMDKLRQVCSVHVLLKSGNYVGKVVTKYGKSTAYTSFFLDGFVGYARCSGYGYNLEDANLREIFKSNREKFEEMGYCDFSILGAGFFFKNGLTVILAV